ncbi:hypothetical protein IEO21_07013 [Rhodonia placenta]|uniref:Uncharacterized protein n=1 Tax=Rhodonia placenta TaxID=104341 RepID=A0A8H7U0L1_9APHY|nr:hypothetical protein IEO21_07013 [Postia placenta]
MSTNPDEEGPDQLSAEERKTINENLIKFADEQRLQPDVDQPQLAGLLADALVKKDFSSVCRLLQQSAKDAGMWEVVNEQKTVRDAWTSPYVGDAHTTLLENVREINSSRGMNPYANSMPLLQSSGMGKSRTVDELAKDIFVIPLNVRREATGYPFPHSDPDIYDYLVSANYKTWEVTMLAYYNFFFHLFSGIREEIRTHLKGPYPSQKELAQAWRTHLAPVNSQEDRRMTLYAQMMRDATKSFYSEKRGQTSTQAAAESRGLELAEAIKELAPISPGGLVMVLWRAFYANATKDVRATLIAVVITKLTGIYDFTGVHNDALRDLLDDACLAALSVRLLLEYLPINEDIMHTGRAIHRSLSSLKRLLK